MARADHIITVAINLDEEQFAESLERLVHTAYMAGFERAQRVGQQEAPEYGYEDWRGYGPGALLPGGAHASAIIRAKHNKAVDPRNAEMRRLMGGSTP